MKLGKVSAWRFAFVLWAANASAYEVWMGTHLSNTGLVPNSGLVIGGSGLNRTLTITPAAGQSGQADITVQAANGTQSASATFKLTVLRALLAATADAEVQPTLGSPPHETLNASANSLLVGTAGGNTGKNRCAVFPFQLPDLGAVANPFNSAWFTVNHESNQNTPLGNVAAYGLGSRSAETVLADDYWSATAATDPADATLLQAVFIPAGSTTFGLKTMDAAGGANLAAYLNAQYAGGMGIGNYVFLRLSADAAQTGGAHRYVFTSADGAVSNPLNHPQLNFLTNDQVQTPTVTLVALGSAVQLTAGSSWSDGLPAHANASYVIPNTGHLKSADGTSTFPGFSLTVEAGGRFQARSLEGSGQVTTVGQLILNGGSSFTTGNFAELAAGTGNHQINVLDGSLTNSGYSRFLSYGTVSGSAITRSLRVQSLIAGFGRIQALENSADGLSSVFIENPGTLLPGATFIVDPTRGPVVSFDGNLGRITTPFTYTLSSSDDFTWTWWAKRAATGSNGAVMVGNRYPESRPGGEKYEFSILFTVEWSDTFLPASWSSAGVTDVPASDDPDNPGSGEFDERIATLPAGTSGKRFVHLKVSSNPSP